jgi:hypothetical protein
MTRLCPPPSLAPDFPPLPPSAPLSKFGVNGAALTEVADALGRALMRGGLGSRPSALVRWGGRWLGAERGRRGRSRVRTDWIGWGQVRGGR